jgi:hypothetical protein
VLCEQIKTGMKLKKEISMNQLNTKICKMAGMVFMLAAPMVGLADNGVYASKEQISEYLGAHECVIQGQLSNGQAYSRNLKTEIYRIA